LFPEIVLDVKPFPEIGPWVVVVAEVDSHESSGEESKGNATRSFSNPLAVT